MTDLPLRVLSPPLKGPPVGNKINVGQMLPHKVLLEDCTGFTMVSEITVTLRIQGISGLLWESTTFRHGDGPSYHENPDYSPGEAIVAG